MVALLVQIEMELVGFGGCIFCSQRGSGDHLNIQKSIRTQVEEYFKSYRAKRANKFIVYFQNFTNTYDSIENLKMKYNSALIDKRIVGISVATRPDCITEEIAELLETYKESYYISVELGLQTSNNETGKRINRGYNSNQFTKAVQILNKHKIDVIAHIIVGLPGEGRKDIENTVKFINNHNIQGIKIHSMYVVKHTKLCEMYEKGEYTPISLEDYLENVTYIITHISPELIIHRMSGDAPKDLLVAPSWNLHKKWILNGLDKKLKEENLYQGMNYKKAVTIW